MTWNHECNTLGVESVNKINMVTVNFEKIERACVNCLWETNLCQICIATESISNFVVVIIISSYEETERTARIPSNHS